METYQQIHGFTQEGDAKFAAFLSRVAVAEANNSAVLYSACLGVLEDNLNGAGGPLAWELSPAYSLDGDAHTFTADVDDLIIEAVEPENDHFDFPSRD